MIMLPDRTDVYLLVDGIEMSDQRGQRGDVGMAHKEHVYDFR